MKGNVAAIVLIAVGVFYLLTNLGIIDINLGEIIRIGWPAILIAVGISLLFTRENRNPKD